MIDPVSETAQKRFKIPYLYPVQRYVIANVLEQINQIVVLPTGSGKSLCFQVPVFLINGLTVVIIPLLSLMADQIRRMEENGITAKAFTGGQERQERDQIAASVKRGEIKVIFTTPEALASANIRSYFDDLQIAHMVIDEAHCVSEWGSTFRPAYLQLDEFIKERKIGVITAFTATATTAVIEKVKDVLFPGRGVSVLLENPDRPNIFYKVIPVLSKTRALKEFVKGASGCVLIFANTRDNTEIYSFRLKKHFPHKDIRFYHAGLDAAERKNLEQWFMTSSDAVMTATSAFGLGIDKPDIRYVIHADIPYSVEAYLQESGRAGRDKQSATAILLHSYDDQLFIDRIADPVMKQRYKAILSYATQDDQCRRKLLLSLLDYDLADECCGCDYCSGSQEKQQAGEVEIVEFIRQNKRRYTLREARLIIRGKTNYDVVKKNLDQSKGFGLLKDWDLEETEDAMASLIKQNKIRILDKGFWKYHLTV